MRSSFSALVIVSIPFAVGAQANSEPTYVIRQSTEFGKTYEIGVPISRSAAAATESIHRALRKCVAAVPIIRYENLAKYGLREPANLYATIRLPSQKNLKLELTKGWSNFGQESTWSNVADSFPSVSSLA